MGGEGLPGGGMIVTKVAEWGGVMNGWLKMRIEPVWLAWREQKIV